MLDILHNQTGETYRGLNRFVDGGDRGDTYDFCAPENDKLFSSSGRNLEIKCLCETEEYALFRISQILKVPRCLQTDRSLREDDLAALEITSTINFNKQGERLDIETTVDNSAKDHRLKVIFPTRRDTDYEYAETPFDVIKRNADFEPHKDWFEQPQPEKPLKSFVLLSDDKGGLAVTGGGLTEYSVSAKPERAIELTLLRCFEWGSRGDLHCTQRGKTYDDAGRAEQAGVFMFLHDTQMLGNHTFNYSVAVLNQANAVSDAVVSAYAHKLPLRAVFREQGGKQNLDSTFSLVAIEPEDVIVTALKAQNQGDGYTLRFYNPREREIKVSLRTFKPTTFEFVNLREELLPDKAGDITLDKKENCWIFNLAKKKIATLKIHFIKT